MPDSSPGSKKASLGLISSLTGLALVAVILWGVISEEAFPLLDSTAVPRGAAWVCPVGLLASLASLVGVVTGFGALSELNANGPSQARTKAWIAVAAGGLAITALVASVIYFLNRGLMQ